MALRVEGALALAIAQLAIAVLPFACVMRLLVRPQGLRQPGEQDTAAAVGRVRRLVMRSARIPWRWAACFPQAIAAHWMLARRGVASRICFGVKRGADGLCSHAWLMCGEEAVIGGESAREFQLVAEFPPREPPRRT